MAGVSKFPCDLCDKGYPELWRLTQHMRVHTGERPFTCDICNRRFTTSSERNRHKRIHLPFDERVKNYVKCKICGQLLASVKSLRGHMKEKVCTKVKVSRRSVWTCVFCAKPFKSIWHLNMHILSKIKERPFFDLDCKFCLKSFLSPAHSAQHVHTHTGERPFICETCGKRFTLECNLKTHNLLHRPVDDLSNNECIPCGKKNMSKMSLYHHVYAVHPAVLYKCKFCELEFKLKSRMFNHIRRAHTKENPYWCKVCNKPFLSSLELNRHENLHKRKQQYQCNICHKDFLLPSRLRVHINTHSSLKPFSCVFCAKSFRTNRLLLQHVNSHTRERW